LVCRLGSVPVGASAVEGGGSRRALSLVDVGPDVRVVPRLQPKGIGGTKLAGHRLPFGNGADRVLAEPPAAIAAHLVSMAYEELHRHGLRAGVDADPARSPYGLGTACSPADLGPGD